MNTGQEIHIIGSGLTGPLMAIYLAKRGYKVALYERRGDMRTETMSAGRSINLALSHRGIEALKEVGLAENILADAIPMKGRMIHPLEGELHLQPYGKDETEVINSVSRGGLNMTLMDAAEKQGVTIHFNHACTGYDVETGTLRFHNDENKKDTRVQAGLVIGSDGAASAIRSSMLETGKLTAHTHEMIPYGYKELTIPPNADGTHQMEINALHIWPRSSYMLIALPNTDGSFTCTLFYPSKGEKSFAALDTPGKVTAFFNQEFPDAAPLLDNLTGEFFDNPTGSLGTVKCFPWHYEDKIALIGDAAHAVVPFYGQGMNCGFEDCRTLNSLVGEHDGDWTKILPAYTTARKVNGDAISDMALAHFIEMRDAVIDPKYVLKKAVSTLLEEKYPEQFIPNYATVAFHPEIPYAEAMARIEAQEELLNTLCADITTANALNWQQAEELLGNLQFSRTAA